MSSDLKAYLAEKYMSGPKADAILSRVAPQKKKKKRKTTAAATPSGSLVRDEDADWGDADKEEPDDVAEAVVASDRAFKKRKIKDDSGWQTIQGREKTPPIPADEQPMVVDGEQEETPFVGGLVTAKQLKKALPSTKTDTSTATADEIAMAQETVYRDATGRKIDTKLARAEAARKQREKEEKDAERMEWGKGVVQRKDEEKRKLELEKQKGKGFRRADDANLNEELKSKKLWNDPAAAFLSKAKRKGPRRPEYNGPPPPPNRFGIWPGYRWDGVDRGNGFEKKLFQTQNEKKRQGLASYQWSAEDM